MQQSETFLLNLKDEFETTNVNNKEIKSKFIIKEKEATQWNYKKITCKN